MIWRAPHVQHVQVTVAESTGIGSRGEFYEETGALLDMMQNHMLHLLCVIAREPELEGPQESAPSLIDVIENLFGCGFDNLTPEQIKAAVVNDLETLFSRTFAVISEEQRTTLLQNAIQRSFSEKLDERASEQQRSVMVLNELQMAGPEESHPEKWVVRGQYEGYRDACRVDDDSDADSFIALQVYIRNARWLGVPFFFRTGKQMNRRVAMIRLQFVNGDHLTCRLQPNPRVIVSTDASYSALRKLVADGVAITEAQDAEDYPLVRDRASVWHEDRAYETILDECLKRDVQHSVAIDWVKESWALVSEVQRTWRDRSEDAPLRPYTVGSNGPDASDLLIRDAGYEWAPLGKEQPMQ